MPQTEIVPLYINPETSRESIEQMIQKVKEEKVLLVFAGHTDSKINIVDLKLLKRLTSRLGKQLAISTRNAKLVDAANHLQINHFRTPSHARRETWESSQNESEKLAIPNKNEFLLAKPERYHPTHQSRRWREWGMAAAFLALSLFGFLLIFSRAQIIIEPIPQSQSIPLDVIASSANRAATLTGEMPIHTNSTILEITGSHLTSGSVSFPEGYATGTITISNLTEKQVELPAGMTIQTKDVQPVKFTTDNAVQLEPVGDENSTMKVNITAAKPGRDGNVPSGSIRAVVGKFGSAIEINNTGATFGGYNRQVNAPSSNDLEDLRESLISDLNQQASEYYNGQMALDGFVLLEDSIQIDEILTEETVPLVGEPAEEFHMTLRVRYIANYLDPADLESVGTQLLDASIKEGYTVSTDDLQITTITPPELHGDEYHWSILIHRQIIPDFNKVQLNQFAGQPRRKLISWFEDKFAYTEEIIITSSPRFWWRLPVLPQRMEVIIL